MKKSRYIGILFLVSIFCLSIQPVFFPSTARSYENLSQPIYQTTTDYGVMVPMRDSIHVAANICRPKADGKFPAVVAFSPYGKAVNTFFAERGYVAVFAEIRGCGNWKEQC